MVRAYDPVAMENAHGLLPAVEMISDPYLLAKGCDALLVLTEWNEFKNIDLDSVRRTMKQPVIFDGRNIYDPLEMRKRGFIYRGMGRGFEVK
jgi:UDPglucose 6-dehydrogenase